MKTYDVVIVGGAVVGVTLALALTQQSSKPLSIAIVEAMPFNPATQGGFDARSIALSLGTTDILERFGLWNSIKPLSTPITKIQVSDQGHAGMTDIDSRTLNVPALGYVVELSAIGQLYHSKLDEYQNIEYLSPCSVTGLVQKQFYVDIELSSGKTLRSKLVVAADGTSSQCCQLTGIKAEFEDYGQMAIVANVVPEIAHNGRAFERFTSEGPVALLPMSGGRMSLVWCIRPEHAQTLMACDDQAFLDALQDKFGWRLGRIQTSGTRHAYPLKLTVRKEKIAHRFAAVGNAAQTLHPIAGQGFNLGIRDIASLVEEILIYPKDLGNYSGLHGYKTRREGDQLQTISLTSSLVHLFSNSWLATMVGRNLSLMIADNIPALKNPLLSRTLGKIPR